MVVSGIQDNADAIYLLATPLIKFKCVCDSWQLIVKSSLILSVDIWQYAVGLYFS